MPPGRRDVGVGLLWDAAVLKSHDDRHGGVERCLQVRKWPAFALAGRGGISGPWRSFADEVSWFAGGREKGPASLG